MTDSKEAALAGAAAAASVLLAALTLVAGCRGTVVLVKSSPDINIRETLQVSRYSGKFTWEGTAEQGLG